MLLLPGFLFVVISPAADQVINTFATLTAGVVAALAWIRFRETGQADSLFQSSAFLVLFAGGVVALVLALTDLGDSFGFERSAPGQAPIYLWTAQRLLAGPLLLIAALTALSQANRAAPSVRRLPGLIALGPTVVVLGAAVLIVGLHNRLPVLLPPETLRLITQPLDHIEPLLFSVPMAVSQLAIAGLYVVAGLVYGWSYLRSRRGRLADPPEAHRPYDAYLSIGLIVAAFSQLHFSIVPGAYGELVTSGDVLRVTFYTVIGLGVAAAARQDLRELRQANITLRRLREADSERIVLEERARLAREVHDGLVQDLWLARLTHGQLAQAVAAGGQLDPELRRTAERLDSILEDALAEARQAVVSLQPQGDASFGTLVRRLVEDHADRFGMEIECDLVGPPVSIPSHMQAEVLRICREAINNARKHADASLVRVRFESDGAAVRLTISDNGRGFDSNQPQRGFGLKSMQDRATGIGGRLDVDSELMNGTRVVLELVP